MKLNKRSKIYLGITFLLGGLAYGFLIYNFTIKDFKMLIFWTLLSIIVESLVITFPSSQMGVSVGSAVNLAAIITGGPLLGTTASFLGMLFRCIHIKEDCYAHVLNTPYYKSLFNVSQSIIVTSIMGLAYLTSGGKVGVFALPQTILIMFIGISLNAVIISGLISSLEEQSFMNVWYSNIKGSFTISIAIASIGIIIALAFMAYGYGAVILFFGPLLLARYSFKLYVETRSLYLSTIQAFNSAMEAKDPYTYGHGTRVEDYAVTLAKAYGLDTKKIQDIKYAAVLHDIGKIGINDNILNKPGKLTEAEYEEIKRHPSIGAEIISEVDFLKNASIMIRYHHERYDGKGYPEGLCGDEIPIEASILAIVDAYDAMTSNRPYRDGLTEDQALREIEKNSGMQFHPELAMLFCQIVKEATIAGI